MQSDSLVEVALSPWVVLDDDGQEVLALNAFPPRRPSLLLKDRDDLRGVLARLGEPAKGRESESYKALLGMGALTRGKEGPLPPPNSLGVSPTVPFLQQVEISIELASAWQSQVGPVASVCTANAMASWGGRTVLELQGPLAVEHAEAFAVSVNVLMSRAGCDPRIIKWRLRLPSLEDPRIPEVLEKLGEAVLIVEDRGEVVTPHGSREELWRGAEHLAKAGFTVRPAIVTRCAKEAGSVVGGWQVATDRAGIAIEPLVTDTLDGQVVDPLREPDEYAAAFETLSDIGRSLGSALIRSEPWHSIVSNAAVPGAQRYKWGKPRANGHLTSNGRWARSRAHAEALLFGSASELLLRATHGGEPSARYAPRDGAPWPRCSQCAFAPLCDGYWSPTIDVLARTGLGERAALAANLACAIRKDTLYALLTEVRSECATARTSGVARATYETGHLTIQRRAK